VQSLERFVFDGTEIIKKVLVSYADTLMSVRPRWSLKFQVSNAAHSATYTTQNYLATHARSAVDNVSAETDTSILAASLRRSLALSIPSPTLYYNYQVGECQDLIFGVTLADYATARGSENDVPKILRICIDEIDKRGLDAEGIYRVSPSKESRTTSFLFAV
jgi:RhoGAP domain